MNRMEKLMEIFREAAESERLAKERYQEAASLCQDPALKELLLSFAEDEQRHEREIVTRFREFAEKYGGLN